MFFLRVDIGVHNNVTGYSVPYTTGGVLKQSEIDNVVKKYVMPLVDQFKPDTFYIFGFLDTSSDCKTFCEGEHFLKELIDNSINYIKG